MMGRAHAGAYSPEKRTNRAETQYKCTISENLRERSVTFRRGTNSAQMFIKTFLTALLNFMVIFGNSRVLGESSGIKFGALVKRLVLNNVNMGYDNGLDVKLKGSYNSSIKIWVRNITTSYMLEDTKLEVDGMPREVVVPTTGCPWLIKRYNKACYPDKQLSFIHKSYETGFCCSCKHQVGRNGGSDSNNGTWHTRGYLHCNYTSSTKASDHCMQHSNLSYRIYKIRDSTTLVNVAVEYIFGNQSTNFSFSTKTPIVENGEFRLEIRRIHNLHASDSDISGQNLLVATSSHQTDPHVKSFKNSLVVSDHMIDITGQTCGKIGVKRPAFDRHYRMKLKETCGSTSQTCLFNQPYQLYIQDMDAISNKKTPKHVLSSFGYISHKFENDIQSGGHHSILLDSSEHLTSMELSLTYRPVFNSKHKQRIISANIREYSITTEASHFVIAATISNDGLFDGVISLNLRNCSHNSKLKISKEIHLDSYDSQYVRFKLKHESTEMDSFFCTISIEENENVVDSKILTFQFNGSCTCVDECNCECDRFTKRCPSVESNNFTKPILENKAKLKDEDDESMAYLWKQLKIATLLIFLILACIFARKWIFQGFKWLANILSHLFFVFLRMLLP